MKIPTLEDKIVANFKKSGLPQTGEMASAFRAGWESGYRTGEYLAWVIIFVLSLVMISTILYV